MCMLYYSDIFKWISWAEYISILIQNSSISFQLTEQDLVNIELVKLVELVIACLPTGVKPFIDMMKT